MVILPYGCLQNQGHLFSVERKKDKKHLLNCTHGFPAFRQCRGSEKDSDKVVCASAAF